MRPFESREPGVVTAIWDTPTVNASIIVDGYHCDYATVRIAKRLKRGRLNDEGKLAGSAITLLDAVRNCIHHVGIPKDEAFRMASMYPAQHLGLGDKFGRIKTGYSADLVVLDPTQMLKSLVGGATIVEK